ncbi:hypothetical protein L1049_025416 [Liquidambar formosana]|uniref:Multifunctional methyltransferase subunit TRM112-like protein n=1 Tax=Liquidambar formosana TaxID=63359 RepID=A0AAP0NBT6_LIQFO
MANDAALRSSLVWLAAIIVCVGAYTYSFKKMLATYVFGMFAIAGVLLPDWDFFDRHFSQWGSLVTLDDANSASAQRSIWTRLSAASIREREMRLLTHNMLSSNIKGVTSGFPLRLEVEKVVEKQVDFNADFLKNMFVKIEWKALVDASRAMGYADLPDQTEPSMLDSEEFLKKFHHALLELHLEEGALICPETGRRFPVNKGIPNMLLHEDEV